MNKTILALCLLASIVFIAGCDILNPAANVARTRVEYELKQAGCEYKLGKVEVEEEQLTAAQRANGINSAAEVCVSFIFRATGSSRQWTDWFVCYHVVNGQIDRISRGEIDSLRDLGCKMK